MSVCYAIMRVFMHMPLYIQVQMCSTSAFHGQIHQDLSCMGSDFHLQGETLKGVFYF